MSQDRLDELACGLDMFGSRFSKGRLSYSVISICAGKWKVYQSMVPALSPVRLVPALLVPAVLAPARRSPTTAIPAVSWHLRQLSSWLFGHKMRTHLRCEQVLNAEDHCWYRLIVIEARWLVQRETSTSPKKHKLQKWTQTSQDVENIRSGIIFYSCCSGACSVSRVLD